MNSSTLRRSASGAAVAALVVAGVGLVSTPARAATLGTLTVSPATGTGQSVSVFTSTGQCASGNATLRVSGGSGGGAITGYKNLNGATPIGSWNSGSVMVITASQTWGDFARANSLTALLGTYTVQVLCQSSGDTFDGQVRFTAPGSGSAINDATYVGIIPTTTAVSAITDSTYGTSKTFTATVTSSVSSQNPTGSVQFKDGGTNIGSPQTVGSFSSGVGTATLASQNLATGSHSITAVFTPDTAGDNAGVATSTATAKTYTVSQNTPTVVVTDDKSGTAQQGSTVVLTANVGTGIAGTVDFAYKIGSGSYTSLATGRTVTTGTGLATYSWSLPYTQTVASDYTIKATFNPTDTTNYATGQTGTESFAVTLQPSYSNSETIQVNVPSGALAATVSSNTVVTLTTPVIATDGTHFIATGTLNNVRVDDSRAGDFGWVANAQVSDFVACSSYSSTDTYYNNPSNTASTATVPSCSSPTGLSATSAGYQKTTISGYNLGIAPSVTPLPSYTLAPGVVAGSAINAANVLPGATSSNGLGASRRIVTATGGTGTGSATGTTFVGGALTLNIPTVNVAGSYAATLTVTVI